MAVLKIGDKSINMTPSNWVQLDGGVYTPQELRIIANAIESNYDKVNGDKDRHTNKLGIKS